MHATTWSQLENTIKTDKKPDKKATYYLVPFIWNVKNRQIWRYWKYVNGSQGLEENENEEWIFNDYGFSFQRNENIWKLDISDSCYYCLYLKCLPKVSCVQGGAFGLWLDPGGALFIGWFILGWVHCECAQSSWSLVGRSSQAITWRSILLSWFLSFLSPSSLQWDEQFSLALPFPHTLPSCCFCLDASWSGMNWTLWNCEPKKTSL